MYIYTYIPALDINTLVSKSLNSKNITKGNRATALAGEMKYTTSMEEGEGSSHDKSTWDIDQRHPARKAERSTSAKPR